MRGKIHTTGLISAIARQLVADQKQPRPRRRADRDHTASPKMGKGADRATIRPEPAYRFKCLRIEGKDIED